MSSPVTTRQVLDATALRAAGRVPATPFSVLLADGSCLEVVRLLRVLPGKRIVGEGWWDGQHVLVKLFVATGSARHWAQEKQGIEALVRSGVPTPHVARADRLPDAGHLLLTEFVENACSLADAWKPLASLPVGDERPLAVLAAAFHTLGRLHAQGLIQEDLHLGNFLRRGDEVLVIDGDAVRSISPGVPLGTRQACANVALLLAQLPVAWDAARRELLAAYVTGGGPRSALTDAAVLDEALSRVRAWRLRDFLGKTVRDCTLFSVDRTSWRFSVVLREEADFMAQIMAAPDDAMRAGEMLKDGRTSTVAQVAFGGRSLVIKRYNLKGLRHALARLWRPSRAWHSWREAHRLAFFGIATPRPLALVEERVGPFRRRAYFITDHCPGTNLLKMLSAAEVPQAEVARAIQGVFKSLHDLRISHGDLKATNLLWHAGQVFLIDLDAMRQHASSRSYAKAWARDRARFLRNWPSASCLHQWLDGNLPPAGA